MHVAQPAGLQNTTFVFNCMILSFDFKPIYFPLFKIKKEVSQDFVFNIGIYFIHQNDHILKNTVRNWDAEL